jgi:hypothetical protein
MQAESPLAVVQAQLDAYNAKDIDALLDTYAIEAESYEHSARAILARPICAAVPAQR